MSRIGKSPIALPKGVEYSFDKATGKIKVKGAKGELEETVNTDFNVVEKDGSLTVERPSEQKRHKSLHGLYRSLINNMVIGVSEGYEKKLELVGVGYKATVQGQVIELGLGYSHNIFLALPKEVKVTAETQKGKNPIVTLQCCDKQLIGQVAAKLRSLRKIEPYKGKGVRFVGEVIRQKVGKAAAK